MFSRTPRNPICTSTQRNGSLLPDQLQALIPAQMIHGKTGSCGSEADEDEASSSLLALLSLNASLELRSQVRLDFFHGGNLLAFKVTCTFVDQEVLAAVCFPEF